MRRKKTTKIEKWKLGPRILGLMLDEAMTPARISEQLKSEGFDVSESSVQRFVREQRENARDQVADLLKKHVEGTVPDDLDALEDIEAKSLEWAKEEPDKRAARISAWGKVTMFVKDWLLRLQSAAVDEKEKLYAEVVDQSLQWLQEDFGDQIARLRAMKMATNVIDLKLKYATVLEGAGQGNIIIKRQGEESFRDDGDPEASGQPEAGSEKKTGRNIKHLFPVK